MHRIGHQRSDLPADDLVEGYVAWREASAEVLVAHRRWASCERVDGLLAAAAYEAALDREQKAASVYEWLINRQASCDAREKA